ncbi:M56 family metallopeptidase [Blastococcus sp. TML/M2B]|uniref:M56 family metallopeptidase n=1 Tax=unclassified Blastococcus TaxID=2619396 RepID=UPI001909FA40|nr:MULTISPECIES: M56 family metallopeptidase [unclassified Blastococcus]MBN1092143.1 M56 family metallopeptidase [Blastococcus sp. TML/M2B]MBN1097752.1 M56 family metallopeptidase [Blastococcus sp. TML/C7B]
MIASLSLLCVAAAILLVGPRLASAPWARQAPRVAIFAWQALTISAVITVVLAGVTLLIPITALAGDLGAVVHACAMSVADAYGESELLPGKLFGAFLAGALPMWLLICGVRVLGGGWWSRRQLRRSLSLITETDAGLGISVIETPAPAAFCLPGRSAQIVVTRGALSNLSSCELDGVLAHEAAHLRGRHNLAVALSQILARAFPRVRLFQVATRETRQLIELLADDAALQRVDRVNLASAIVSLAEMKAPAAALAMAQDAAVLRVSRLLSPEPPLNPWRYRVAVVGALTVVVAPLLIAGYPAVCAALSDICNIP